MTDPGDDRRDGSVSGAGRSPGPRPFALLGRPVAHSLSPDLHASAFRALDVDAAYVALETEDGEVEPVMRILARSGGGGNVTLPHKERAAGAVDRASASVRATGACNCFWGNDQGELAGDNTDVDGFLEAVAGLLPGEEAVPRGLAILLLGAGGGARAVLHACLSAGARRIDLLNRTTRRAEAVADRVGGGEGAVRVARGRDDLDDRYDLVVNATRLGMEPGDPLPLDLSDLEVRGAFDLVYEPRGTEWVRHARRLGIPARDGREMLVRQAAASLERWLGRPAPIEALREAAGPEGS